MIEAYFRQIKEGLDHILAFEKEKIEQASEKIAQTVEEDGVIHIFGCGHSHMMAEEVFYRSGGLAAVNPILVEPLMLHEGAVQSSRLERTNNYGLQIINKHNISQRDVVIVVSTSGRNPVPIDVALAAKEVGSFVLALTSFKYTTLASRHISGKHLLESVDLAINNHVEMGDAVMKHENVTVPFTPVSSIYNMTILNAIFAQAIAHIADRGGNPPVFLSGNIDHADEHNLKLIDLYKEKIPLLKVDG